MNYKKKLKIYYLKKKIFLLKSCPAFTGKYSTGNLKILEFLENTLNRLYTKMLSFYSYFLFHVCTPH